MVVFLFITTASVAAHGLPGPSVTCTYTSSQHTVGLQSDGLGSLLCELTCDLWPDRLLAPLRASFVAVLSAPDFRQLYQEDAVRLKLLGLIEAFIGQLARSPEARTVMFCDAVF